MNGPCPGLTMLRTPEGHPFVSLHYTADETMTPERIKALRAKLGSDAYWNREMEMDAHALDGALVFPDWDRTIHVIPDEKIPKHGCIYMSIDPHPRTPHAIIWVLIDRFHDWYLYRELWPSVVYGTARRIKDSDRDNSELKIRDYAEMIAVLEGNSIRWHNKETDREYGVYERRPGGEKIALRFMDQAGKAFRASGESELMETYARRYSKYGIKCCDPMKSLNVGEESIHELLRPRTVDDAFAEAMGASGTTWPRLHIAASCFETQFEFANHRYKETRSASQDKELKQEGSEFRKHMLDNLRYLATSQAGYYPRLETTRHSINE